MRARILITLAAAVPAFIFHIRTESYRATQSREQRVEASLEDEIAVAFDGTHRQLSDLVFREMNFNGESFGDVLDVLRARSEAKIEAHWRNIEQQGINRDAPCTIRLRNASFG